MDRNALWKWLILIVLVTGSLVLVTPPKDKIRLGLDLRGGTSFAVKIDEDQIRAEIKAQGEERTPEQIEAEVQRVLSGAQDRALEVIRNRVDNLGISEPIIYPGKDNRIIIQLPGVDEEKRKEAERSLQSLAFLEFRMVHEKNTELVEALFEKLAVPEGYRIVTIGDRRFYQRDPSFPETSMDAAYREKLGRFHVPDPGHEFLLEKEEVQNQTAWTPVFVKRRRELSGEFLKDAAVDYQALGQPVVKIEFDAKGARKFANITADYAPGGSKNPSPNRMRQLAIVLDGTLYSAPNIKEAIYGGKAEISGRFTAQEANFLANILRAGSLPAPVKIVEKRFVAPTLGEDSIRSGVRAAVYGSIGVIVFMAAYYLLAGMVANIALLLDFILLPVGMILTAGFMSIFVKEVRGGGPIQLPVLTLPGIAGIALTVGMAVDANVLIFERIREELKSGKRLWTAVLAGYDRAFLAILDSNLTTLLTGVILFVFGSGPIRGYAVTLCAGIAVSMYTALTVTKLIFGLICSKSELKTLKMLQVIKETHVDFIAWKKPAILISLAIIAGSWAVMVGRGVKNPSSVLGVDFTGGTSVTLTFDKDRRVDVEEIRKTLATAGVGEAHIQYQKEVQQDGDVFLQIKTGFDPINGVSPTVAVKNALTQTYPDSKFEMLQEDEVGPQIGSELKMRAVWSICLALLGIIVYLAWRFELGFAMGAIVALVHDVLVTTGVFCLLGYQLSLPVIAALLTIVGFSVNDTIVVFDRIRENLRLVRNITFKEVCNLSVNQTLSRTILTSFTVLITVGALLVFGGGTMTDFALTLFIGLIAGSYSTVYIATPVVLWWHRDRRPEFATAGK